ncbi:MAG: monooxygenase [Deltaproteobacteria bacterium]|nr:monooxygenase [Deltaproteobacteria bacterium]
MRLLILVAALALGGCFYDNTSPLPADFGSCAAPEPEGVAPAAPTYWRDLKPIVDAHCAGCHIQGGVAPFPLTTYRELYEYRSKSAAMVETRAMPPWQPAACCGHYRGDRSLTADQVATFVAWYDAGALEGDPADATPSEPPVPEALPRVDVEVRMAQAFTPEPRVGKDELRCFLLPQTFATATYITGTNVIPSNHSIAHHAVLFAVPADKIAELKARDGADGRPGWDCYSSTDELDARGAVGGWQPGDGPQLLPDGVGVEVKAGSQLVLNMHYDTGAGTGSDQTTVQLMTSPSVARVSRGVAIMNPLWFAGDGMEIRADDPDATVFFAYDPTPLFSKGQPFTVERVMLHMHELGTIGRLAVLHPDGTSDCLLNITDWNFHWMTTYTLAAPVAIQPGDKLYLECHWDNTAGNQKTVDGNRQAPRTIGWGADEEMCAAVVSYSEAL